ncbi:MAG: hypothetical protein Q8R60_13385 [Mycobacteriales bacterium]|nr:hypothetical protein [Mycobacteriales bacterium]
MTLSGRLAARRTVAMTGAATLVATVGLTAWIGTASADACPAWTDPKGDSTTGQAGIPLTEDAQMDITAAAVGTVGDSFVIRITTDGLGDSSSDAGDEFGLEFTLAGQEMLAYADRIKPLGVELDVTAAILNFTSDTPNGAATATYDVKSKTVTITGKLTELAKSVGKPVAGQSATGLNAYTSNQVDGLPVTRYDDAPTKLTTTIGTACEMAGGAPAPAPSGSATGTPSASATPTASASPSGSASPTATASPSGSASPTPSGAPPAAAAGLPRAGCFTFADAKGDAPSVVSEANDPDLDLLGLTLQSTPETTKAFLKVDKLGKRPAEAPGHTFSTLFTAGKKLVQIVGTAYDPAQITAVHEGLASVTAPLPVKLNPPTRLSVDGTAVTSTLKVTYDATNSTVIMAIPTAELTKATAGEFDAGKTLTAVLGRASAQYLAASFTVDTTAKDNAAAATPAETWTVGDNACFTSPTTLTNLGATKAQFGDVAKLAVKLADSAGKPVAGQKVTLALPGTTATVTTGTDGVARVAMTVRATAGATTMTAAFAGAGAFDKSALSVPFTVAVEKTVLSAKGAKGAVTATLLDDDKKAVAGQTVTFAQGSVKKTAKTDAKGVAKVSGLKPGQAVKVTYAGLAGKYAATSLNARS